MYVYMLHDYCVHADGCLPRKETTSGVTRYDTRKIDPSRAFSKQGDFAMQCQSQRHAGWKLKLVGMYTRLLLCSKNEIYKENKSEWQNSRTEGLLKHEGTKKRKGAHNKQPPAADIRTCVRSILKFAYDTNALSRTSSQAGPIQIMKFFTRCLLHLRTGLHTTCNLRPSTIIIISTRVV